MSWMNDFYDQLFKTVGIKKGDILDVASDLLSFMLYFRERNEKFDANQLLDALKEAVGEEGTILIRTFNWDFCHGTPFNYKTTPSRVGVLGNVALNRPDFKRTKHALYSWCVWGKEQENLTSIDPEDSFGDGSIFSILEEKNAKLLILGDTSGLPTTGLHRSEQRAKVPVRFIKKFKGQYIDEDGVCSEKTYTMFVRDLDYEFHALEDRIVMNLFEKNAMVQRQYDGVDIALIDLKKAGEACYQDILDGKFENWTICTKITDTEASGKT